nr:carboxypeptidase-like regulatory domain-containing protein [Bacteroidales bacterium]
MRTLSFALLLLFSVCAVKAQQQIIKQSVIVSGIVRDGVTVEALQGVRVLRNNSASSLTGADGSFIVNALSSDTLVFKALGYKDAILILRD